MAELQAAPPTCDLSGTDEAPAGFHRLEQSAVLTRRDVGAVVRDLLGWQMHDRAGLRVEAEAVPLRAGTVVLMHLGFGVLSLGAPCRVMDVLDEPRRHGFSYATLPGHPESGLEEFLLQQQDDGSLRFTVTAVSRPASLLTRVAGPVASAAQRIMTTRYLRALDRT